MTPRRAAAGLAVAGALLALGAAPACGSTDCSETLTCADQPGSDGSPDVTIDQGGGDRGAGDVVGRPEGGDASGSSSGSGSGSGSSGGSSSGSSSGGSSSGVTCEGGSVENCTNGVDDNCDGLVDCADPMCKGMGFTCVPAAPMGWTGPSALYSGNSVPSCAGGYPNDALDGNDGLNAPPASCSCACGAAQGATCGDVALNLFLDGACGSNCGADNLQANVCAASPCVGASGASASPPAVQGGSCTPSGMTSVPPPTWSASQRACTGPVGAGCSAGMVCAASLPMGFNQTACVFASGAQPCPMQYPNAAVTTYGSFSDSRSCTACTCGNPTGLTCSTPVITLWSDANCAVSQVATLNADGSCNPLHGNGGVAGAEAGSYGVQGNGSCATGGGAPTGSASPTMPTSVCCM